MSNGGYLAGGFYQVYDGLPTSGTPTNQQQWGTTTNSQQLLGQSRQTQPNDHVQYSWLFLTDQLTVGALKIVGGHQFFQEGDNWREDFVWGNRTLFEEEVYSTIAYDNNISSWTQARIRLYVTEATTSQIPGYRLVGVKQEARDLESKRPYFTINEWGDTSAQQQFLGIGQSWSPAYDWGFSQITLFLAPV